MTPQTRRLIVPVIAAGLPLTFAAPAQGQEAADQDRQQQLEARIEQLERQLRELSEKMSSTPPAPAPEPPAKMAADAPIIQVKPITPNAVPGTRFL
jgi:hypothetical protein